jgi:2'-5' RNA ligase
MGIRSFLAFELPPDMKDVVYRVSGELKRSSLRVRWVKPENIHLTVVFLGSIAPEDLPSIRESTRNVCRGHGPFNVMIRGMGRFGNRRHPRVLWLGLAGDLTQMDAFRDELQDMLRPFGIQREKRVFNPHLTLGRFRKGARASEELDGLMAVYENLKSSVCTLDKLALFKSDLRPDGAVYTQLAEWPLGG